MREGVLLPEAEDGRPAAAVGFAGEVAENESDAWCTGKSFGEGVRSIGDAESGSRSCCVCANDPDCDCVSAMRARSDSGACCANRRILHKAASSWERGRDWKAAAEFRSDRGVAETDAERRGVAVPLRSRERPVRSEAAAAAAAPPSEDQNELESDCSDLKHTQHTETKRNNVKHQTNAQIVQLCELCPPALGACDCASPLLLRACPVGLCACSLTEAASA